MDRRELYGAFSCSSMPVVKRAAVQLLLSSCTRHSCRATAHASSRRDLHGAAISWLAQNRPGSKKGRILRQPQTYSANYAAIGISRESTRAKYLETPSGTHQVSLSAEQCDTSGTFGCLEHRYHVYPTAQWLCVSRCCHRLVQSPRAIVSTLQQSGYEFLPGGSRRSNRTAWKAQNLQHRSRGAVYLKRIRAGDSKQGYSLQHGWSRSCLGQCFCGEVMEISKI